MKKICLVLLLCFGFVLASSKDTLIIAVENEQERLNPLFSEDHDAAIGLIFSGLIRYDEKMNIQPDLASSWKISKDGLEYDFILRTDVLWHDGKPFSAKDVQFTLQTLLNPKFHSPIKPNFNAIKDIQITGPHSIKIRLKNPYPALLDALNLGIVPAHLLENKNLNKTSFNQAPIGTGPFKLKEWKKGQYKVLEANENFYLGKVQSAKLILRTINDANVASIELKSGKIDAALIGFEFLKDFQKDERFKLLIEKSADYRALMFNFNNAFLANANIRKALNYAVNKELISKNLLHELGGIAHHPLQQSWAGPKKFKSFEYNPSKAQKLLEAEGFVKNKEGIYSKDGKELSFEIWAMSNDSLRVLLSHYLASEFQKIGIRAKVLARPAGSFDYSVVDSFLVGWGSPYDPDFHTYRVFGSFEGENDWNFGHYKDERVNEALQKARTSLDPNQRKKAYAKFIEALYENPPFIFLAYLDFALVYSKDISGVKPYVLGHHGVGFTYNAWQWSKN